MPWKKMLAYVTGEVNESLLARDNPFWGYDRIAGAMRNLGYEVSDQTVGNILKRNGMAPSPERRRNTTWRNNDGCQLDTLYDANQPLLCRNIRLYERS